MLRFHVRFEVNYVCEISSKCMRRAPRMYACPFSSLSTFSKCSPNHDTKHAPRILTVNWNENCKWQKHHNKFTRRTHRRVSELLCVARISWNTHRWNRRAGMARQAIRTRTNWLLWENCHLFRHSIQSVTNIYACKNALIVRLLLIAFWSLFVPCADTCVFTLTDIEWVEMSNTCAYRQ